jgi:hypothetical protein
MVPPLLSERGRAAQLALAVAAPIAFGAIVGLLLGRSASAYTLLSLLAIVGGIAAGYDHDGAPAGARRGVFGGLLFGAAIIVAHEIDGSEAKADLPDPAILLVVVTSGAGTLLGALGGWLRGRRERRLRDRG